MIEPILYSEQLEHFNRLSETLERYSFAVDASEPGTGKTHVAAALAVKYKRPILVIGPNSARLTWERAINDYKLKTTQFGFVNYERFRPNIRSKKHEFFTKIENDEFVLTDSIKKIIHSECIIIFDEAQALKNRYSLNFSAAKMVMNEVRSSKSWVMFLSGSLIDKETQPINFLYLLNIISNPWLYTNVYGNIDLSGLAELHSWVRGSRLVEEFRNCSFTFAPNPKIAKKYIYDIFVNFIKPEIISIMPRVIRRDSEGNDLAQLNVKNGFYRLDRRERLLYEEVISKTNKILFETTEGGSLDGGLNVNLSSVVRRLIEIQKIKVKSLIRVVKEDLNEKYKVIIYSNYEEVITELKIALAEHNPIVLTGKIKTTERDILISKFEEDNGNYRLLIANTTLGSKSLNLHDKTGNHPRRMYIMPSYFINDLHQAVFRTYRVGTVGVAYVRFFYGLTDSNETEVKLLEAIIRSGRVMADIMKEQKVPFPSDYENEYEEKFADETEEELLERLRKLATDD